MQPRVLTLPDSLRDALERDLKRAFPKNPVINKTSGHEKEIDACKQIVAWHLFGIAPEDPDLVTGASADHKTDPETKQFLKEFYQAYLGMECGTSAPALQIENLPPKRGSLFNIGLMHSLANTKNLKSLSVLGAFLNSAEQPAHRDMGSYSVGVQRKTLQSLYCKSPGKIAQPTVFVSIDEALDLLAKNEGGDFIEARKQWVERLSSIRIKDWYNETVPLLIPNPGREFHDPASPYGQPPEYIMYSRGRFVDDYGFVHEPDPAKHEQKVSDYSAFAGALKTLMHENAATATGSITANTMLLWNDVLVLHGRGSQLGEGVQKNRKIVAVEATHQPHPTDPDGLAHAIGGPCSRVNLDQLTKLGTSAPVNQRARTS